MPTTAKPAPRAAGVLRKVYRPTAYALATALLLAVVWPSNAVVYTADTGTPRLSTGDFWAYRTIDQAWNTTTREFRLVQGEDAYEGQRAIVLDTFIFVESGRGRGSIRLKQWITPDWGLLHEKLVWHNGVDEVRTYRPPLQLYSFPLEEGKSWKSPMNMSGVINNGTTSVEIFWRGGYGMKVVGVETVVAPAGVYRAYAVAHSSAAGDKRMVYYFSSDLKNTIKEEYQVRVGGGWEPISTTELTTFSVRTDPDPSLTVPLSPSVLMALVLPLALALGRRGKGGVQAP